MSRKIAASVRPWSPKNQSNLHLDKCHDDRNGQRFLDRQSWSICSLLALSSALLTGSAAWSSGGGNMVPIVMHPTYSAPAPHIFNVSLPVSAGNSSNLAVPSVSRSAVGSDQNVSLNSPSSSSNVASGGHNHSAASLFIHPHVNETAGGLAAAAHSSGLGHTAAANNSTANNSTANAAFSPATALLNGGYKLDLSSTSANIVLGSNLFNHSQTINITVGGAIQSFSAGQKVTAAEYIAIQQQMSAQGQTLILDDHGAADGGKFNLNGAVNGNVSELLVPKGVTALDYFSKNNALSINGDLFNYGSIYGVSTNGHVTGGSISAIDVTNESSGLISTTLPNSLLSTIPHAGAIASLTINALDNLTNAGVIDSSAAITLATTHGAITNSSNGGSVPTIQAANDVNLNTGNGNVVNSGLVSSRTGNINITAANDSADITVIGNGGNFQATTGNINVRNSSYTGTGNVNIVGGDYATQNLNLYSGQGAIQSSVGQLSGTLNSFAQVEHFNAMSNTLVLGSNTINGDPTFANAGTGAQGTGNIVINGSNSFTESVAILAAGNITSDSAGEIFDNGPSGNNNVVLIAGATITFSGTGTGGASTTSVNLSTAAPLTGSQVASVNFSSAFGGNVDVHASLNPFITANGTGTGNGGNVSVVAFDGFAGTAGTILFNPNTTSISTYGGDAGHGGTVLVAAGHTPTTGSLVIQLGDIQTVGGTGAGNVAILASQPSSFAQPLSFDKSGTMTGTLTSSGTIDANAQITVGSINAAGGGGLGATPLQFGKAGVGGAGGQILIEAGSSITTKSLFSYGGGGGGSSNSLGEGNNGGAGGGITVNSTGGDVTITGSVNSSGGGGGGYRTTATTGGQAGSIEIVAANGTITITGGGVAAADGGAGGASRGSGIGGLGPGGGGGGSLGGGGGGSGGSGGDVNGNGGGGGGGAGFASGGGGGSGDGVNSTGGGGDGGGGFLVANGGAAGGGNPGSGMNPGQEGVIFVAGNGGDSAAGKGGLGGNNGTSNLVLTGLAGGGGTATGFLSGQSGQSVLLSAGVGANISVTNGTVTAGHNQPLVIGADPDVFGQFGATGGTATFTTAGTQQINISTAANGLQINVPSGGSGGNGGIAIITTGGKLVVDPSAITINPAGSTGAGGNLFLTSPLVVGANGAVPLVLNASGVGSGSGGLLSITQTTATAQSIGSAAGNFNLIANSGSGGGGGGTVTFSTGGNLTVNSAQLSVTAAKGQGGQINLTAGSAGTGTGALSIIGTLDVDGVGGGGGSLTLVSNSPSALIVGPVSAAGSTSTTGGTISVTNKDGGVTNTAAITNVRTLILDAGAGSISVGPQLGSAGTNSITLTSVGAGDNITYTNTRNPIVGTTVTLSSGGTIGTSTSSLILNAQTVGIKSAGGLATITDVSNGETITNGGGTGVIAGTLGYLGTGSMVFAGSLTASGILSVVDSTTLGVANGNIIVNAGLDALTSGSTVNLITNGSGGISGTGFAQGGTVNLTTGSGTIGTNFATPFEISAPNVAPTSTGVVSITDAQSMTLIGTGISAASSVHLLTMTNGDILIHGQVGNNATGAVTLSANGTGTITANADIHGNALTLLSGTGGIGTLNAGALPIVSNSFSANTSGFVNIIDTQTSTAVTMNASQGGSSFTMSFAGPGPFSMPSITATNGPIFVADSGNVTLGALTATTNITVFTQSFLGAPVGNITVNGPIQAGSGGTGFVNLDALKNASPPGPNSLILVNPSASIMANNGRITLEQDNTTNGSIVIGNSSTINTSGAAGGAVNIVIGAVPGAPTQGATPAHVTLNHPGAGTAFFGSNGISVPTGPVNLFLNGANIVFNTGALPASAIILGSNVSITADPVLQSLFSPAPASFVAFPGWQFEANGVSLASGFGAITSATGPHLPGVFSSLSTNAGLVGKVNGAVISNAVGNAFAQNTFNFVNALTNQSDGWVPASTFNSANTGALLPAMPKAIDDSFRSTRWISDTELSAGKIPAVLYNDEELGVTPEISTVVEMENADESAPEAASVNSVATVKSGMPLAGAVSRTAAGARSVNLRRGSVVFAAAHDTLVTTPFGVVKIDAKSVVLMLAYRHGLTIFDLDDVHGQAVVVKAGDREVVLNPGTHTSITSDSVGGFEEINPAQLIGHRNIRERALGQGLKAFISEFSVVHAMQSVTTLTQLANSTHAHGRKVAGHMLKTAAILAQLNQTTYEQVTRPAMTAHVDQGLR
jgi:hypothetical protein